MTYLSVLHEQDVISEWISFKLRTLSRLSWRLAAIWTLLLVLAGAGLRQVEASVSALPNLSLRRDTAPYKGYSGIRAHPDSAQKVFFHDQTIAVVEMQYNSMDLQNCELIEVTSARLAHEALKNLTRIGPPNMLSFTDMSALMQRCHSLDPGRSAAPAARAVQSSGGKKNGFDGNNASTLLNGILPGTKWCGTGDIASSYFDLGAEKDIDRCCRTHDLCPVKVRAFQSRYGLPNMSFYTKSHCVCDDMLLECLKQSGRQTANIMGNIYFNLLRVPCVEDIQDQQGNTKRRYRKPKSYR